MNIHPVRFNGATALQVPPSALESEQVVLGALLKNDACWRVGSILTRTAMSRAG